MEMAFLLDCLKLLDYQNGICILTHPLFYITCINGLLFPCQLIGLLFLKYQ